MAHPQFREDDLNVQSELEHEILRVRMQSCHICSCLLGNKGKILRQHGVLCEVVVKQATLLSPTISIPSENQPVCMTHPFKWISKSCRHGGVDSQFPSHDNTRTIRINPCPFREEVVDNLV